MEDRALCYGELMQLKRMNTPTVCNGWEMITKHPLIGSCYNMVECHDFMPHMGAMVGYAITLKIQPANPSHCDANPDAWSQYYKFVASVPGPKIVVVQDLDEYPTTTMWGEVNSSYHKALGCEGAIVDGCIRDLDEMRAVGFKAIAKRLCVSHGMANPIEWGCEVEVFGKTVQQGNLLHADQHGFMVIPPEDQKNLLAWANFMDRNECHHFISTARDFAGKTYEEILASFDQMGIRFEEECAQFKETLKSKQD